VNDQANASSGHHETGAPVMQELQLSFLVLKPCILVSASKPTICGLMITESGAEE
jgi:hypothetical protein